ncbi:Rsa1p SCDLUD_001085 [Saccharomycodes ludwigii]|uniref:Rsa1p n=1 Tax=Saccharomycodes ludwigii TaxID=36035 RepID=UPI001E849017|nr:hypothetical protein SCDLUD_001085 [Saccharomycodes ludwigii]KAH3903445.1 hypothetical protein SCDLUD_001085 [Saccharomycodes ludwigii]
MSNEISNNLSDENITNQQNQEQHGQQPNMYIPYAHQHYPFVYGNNQYINQPLQPQVHNNNTPINYNSNNNIYYQQISQQQTYPLYYASQQSFIQPLPGNFTNSLPQQLNTTPMIEPTNKGQNLTINGYDGTKTLPTKTNHTTSITMPVSESLVDRINSYNNAVTSQVNNNDGTIMTTYKLKQNTIRKNNPNKVNKNTVKRDTHKNPLKKINKNKHLEQIVSNNSKDTQSNVHGSTNKKEYVKGEESLYLKEIINNDTEGTNVTNKTANPIVIPGTKITLSSEKEILQWREERKKMWLLKISNKKDEHAKTLGIDLIKDQDKLNNNKNIFREARKDKEFIEKITNQVRRYNPKPNLTLSILQKEQKLENLKILNFIKELGDAGYLDHELTQMERNKLFPKHNRYVNKSTHRYNNTEGNPKGSTYINKHHYNNKGNRNDNEP